jgi:hypothetical protein
MVFLPFRARLSRWLLPLFVVVSVHLRTLESIVAFPFLSFKLFLLHYRLTGPPDVLERSAALAKWNPAPPVLHPAY